MVKVSLQRVVGVQLYPGLLSHALVAFNAFDGCPQPFPDSVLYFRLRVLSLHGVDGFPMRVEGNVMAGHALPQRSHWNKVREQALAAWPGAGRVAGIDA